MKSVFLKMRPSRRGLLASVALLALSASARTFELTLWRGETAAALLPDACELGESPAGLRLRTGILKAVKCAPSAGSLQRFEVLDRVKWDERNEDGEVRVVEIAVPPTAKPGVYESGHLRVHVLSRVLPPPSEWKYYLDLWQHPWAVARLARAQPFSPKHYAAMRPVYALLATAGQKTITISLLEQPWDHQCRDAYHSLVEDNFRLFDEYVTFCLSCGLGPDISCYSLCPWTLGRTLDDAALETRWGSFLDRFAAHLKAKGWFKQTIMAMDERAPEDVAKVVAFVQRHAPGLRVSMAGNRKPSDFSGITIDVYSQILDANYLTKDFLEEAAARRTKGLITTCYTCCGPAAPNTFLTSGTGEAFWCGVGPAFLGLDGYLRWAWNSWPENPKEDASFGSWPAGDTFLCYPNGEPSWRFLELRNGIIAAEKLRLLREQGLFQEEFAALAKQFDVSSANARTTDFPRLRRETLQLVNRP